MNIKHLLLTALVLTHVYTFASSNEPIPNDLPSVYGFWKATSKVETEKVDSKIIKQEIEKYQLEEKSYEFTASNKLIIKQGFGHHQETLPFHIKGNQIYLGKEERNKIPYLFTLKGNTLTLVKTKTKHKKGKLIVQTEVVTLVKK